MLRQPFRTASQMLTMDSQWNIPLSASTRGRKIPREEVTRARLTSR